LAHIKSSHQITICGYQKLVSYVEMPALLLYYQNFGSQFTLTSAAKSQAISARRISSTSAGTNA
jgi:hypothetical protein